MNHNAIIVDDEPVVVELLSQLISEHCPDLNIVGSAGNPDEAIKLIESHHPDLVFLDINLPSGSGLQILDHFPTRSFEVVFITGYTRLQSLAKQYKPLGILTKPIEVSELQAIISGFRAGCNQEQKKVIRNENLL
ncbi:MAG: LytR/AlgR family response regulator transcription factor [Bacteroidales bacterium]